MSSTILPPLASWFMMVLLISIPLLVIGSFITSLLRLHLFFHFNLSYIRKCFLSWATSSHVLFGALIKVTIITFTNLTIFL
jgi:hypothetical protein